MKCFLFSGLMILLSSLAMTPVAFAKQTNLNDSAADLNGDGTVTLHELATYNRDQRAMK